ncbi:DegT/DnrJ/EryC1/StrS family aminotransferase, partial [Campylobacter jejuni]
RRTAIAGQLDAALVQAPVVLPPRPGPAAAGNLAATPHATDDLHAWHLYVLRLTADCAVDRDTFIARMAERGIGCSVHYV